MFYFTLIMWLVIAVIAIWFIFNYIRGRRAGKLLTNSEFNAMMHQSQVVDVRESGDFYRKHILGARNLPYTQFKTSLSALRKDKPVLLYEDSRGQAVINAALLLKKAGFKEIYILKYGMNSWNGKTK